MTPCETTDRWLDEGRPGDGAAVRGHAAGCARCAAALAADRALEAALRAPPPGRAPAGLAGAVMAEVTRQAPPAAALARPRWGPLVARGLGAVVLAALAVRAAAPRLEEAARALGEEAARAAPAAAWQGAVEDWLVASLALPPPALTGLSLAAAAAGLGLGWLLWRWSEGLAARA